MRRRAGTTRSIPTSALPRTFRALVADAQELGIEIALDFAIQCSPDHPWLTEHPEWFFRRPDGTLKFAENPPKRYQDIYNVDFDCDDWRGLWQALLDVVLHWVGEGVTVFRVDNPHTKPVAFWEWLIAEVRAEHPEVVFLAEAFTRPAPMTTLAKAGFSQSYTYFTWKNTRWELLEFLGQLLDWRDFYRPNCFANTPDILHEYLVSGGARRRSRRGSCSRRRSRRRTGSTPASSRARTCPVRPGSEEYLNSEKYEVRPRALDGPLLPLVARLNAARRENEALQWLDPLTVLETENEQLFAFLKRRGDNAVVDRRQPRPASGRRRARACCRSRPDCRRRTRARPADGRGVHVADRPQLREAAAGRSHVLRLGA